MSRYRTKLYGMFKVFAKAEKKFFAHLIDECIKHAQILVQFEKF